MALLKAFKESTIAVSPEILEEYRQTPLSLHEDAKITKEQLSALVAAIAAFVAEAKVVKPRMKIAICRDPSDDKFLECCFEANAEILLTGDKDLLDLDSHLVQRSVPGLRIVNPKQYTSNRPAS